jgi:uncharacterized membrane protein
MDETVEKEESFKQIILDGIQHNPQHYIKIKIFGKEIHPCARCFGLWTGLIVGFIISSPFWLGIFKTENFLLIFTLAWLFAIPSIVDWSTVKLGLRKGKNSIRVFTGFLQGMGVVIYFFILPAGIIFKILTYTLYELVFNLIRWRYRIKHYHLNKKQS